MANSGAGHTPSPLRLEAMPVLMIRGTLVALERSFNHNTNLGMIDFWLGHARPWCFRFVGEAQKAFVLVE